MKENFSLLKYSLSIISSGSNPFKSKYKSNNYFYYSYKKFYIYRFKSMSYLL